MEVAKKNCGFMESNHNEGTARPFLYKWFVINLMLSLCK
jgi:hypothetical protein